MKQISILIITVFLTINLYGQKKVRPILWFGPADNVAVYGINLAPIMFKLPNNSVVNGINIEGVGIASFLFMIPHDPTDRIDTIKIKNEFITNGITVAGYGILQQGTANGIALTLPYIFIEQVNGLELSLFFNITYKLNGLSVSFNNSTVDLNGVQIGLFNKAKRVKGLQIGLWNVNAKRKLPIINW